MKKNRLSERILSIALSVAIMFGNIPTTVFATEVTAPKSESIVLECHTQHNDACGYIAEAEGVTGAACTHTCETCKPAQDKAVAEKPAQEDKTPAEKSEQEDKTPENKAPLTSNGDGVMANAAPRAAGAITIVIDSGATTLDGASLEAALAGKTLADVTTLKITAGAVTVADWNYLKSLTALTDFEIDALVTDVADMPDIPIGQGDVSLFPKSIVSVTVPQAITIGDYAFFKCEALTTANFPEATIINERSFQSCKLLTIAGFPKVTKIDESAFSGCEALTTATFPEVKSIPKQAFASCYALKTITFSPEVTTIDTYAFFSCIVLESVNFPAVTTIGTYAFSGCSALTTVTFPKVETLGESAFRNCDKLKTATFPALTSISKGAFYSCDALVTANFLKAITIGDSAFHSCKLLTTANFPIVETIEKEAFFSCEALETTTFPELASIGNYAFAYCTSLTTLNFPKATSIGGSSFSGCTSLTTVTFPLVQTLNGNGFANCTSLTTATFPVVQKIGYNDFNGCTELIKLNLGATPPSTYDSFPSCAVDCELGYVSADGNVLTGDDLSAARAEYKKVDDGDTTDDLWNGWSVIPVVPAIKFDARNGEAIAGAVINTGTITMPAEPTWNDYTFAGWYTGKDGEGTVFANSGLSKSQTVYAKWTKNGKTVLTETLDLKNAETTNKILTEGWAWDETTLTLTLSGLILDKTLLTEDDYGKAFGILLPRESNTIILTDGTQNTIDISKVKGADTAAAIKAGNLTIKTSGNGTPGKLNVFSTQKTDGENTGILVYDYSDFIVESGEIVVKSGESAKENSTGIQAEGSVDIKGGTVTVTSGNAAVMSMGIASMGEEEGEATKISGGTVTATAGDAVDLSTGVFGINVSLTGGKTNAKGNNMAVASFAEITADNGIVNGKAPNCVSVSIEIDGMPPLFTFVDESSSAIKDAVIKFSDSIIFDARNGVTIVPAEINGGKIVMPTNPTWNDYTFAGWFTDKEYKTDFVNSNLTTSQTVYAKWTKNGKTVRTETLDLTTAETTNKILTEGWAWNKDTKTLILDNYLHDATPITTPSDRTEINIPNGATIEVIGTNTVIGSCASAISVGGSNANFTIKGSGTLNAKSNYAAIFTETGDITISNVKINAEAGDFGISTNAKLIINGNAKVSAKATDTENGMAILGGAGITADGATVENATEDFVSGATNILISADKAKPVVIKLTTSVKFDALNGVTIEDAEINDGKIVMPATPKWNDYTFAGWFTDKEYKTDFVNSNLTASKTVYAKWTKNGKTVRTETLDLTTAETTNKISTEGWAWNKDTKTLTLSGLTLNKTLLTGSEGTDAAGIFLPQDGNDDYTIILTDGTQNTIDISKVTGADTAQAIKANNLIIKTSGNGTPGKLNAISAKTTNTNAGIYAKSKITIESGEILAKGDESVSENSVGILSDAGIIHIKGGKVTAVGANKSGGNNMPGSYGLYGSANVLIDGGDVTATGGVADLSVGIWGAQNVTLNGGTINANGSTAAVTSFMNDIKIDDISSVTVNGKPAKIAKKNISKLNLSTLVDESDEILTNALIKFKPTYTGVQALAPNVATSTKTHDTITLNTQTISGETVEYGIEKTVGVITWQDSPVFTGLTADTQYKLYARVKANNAHKSGTISAETIIKTKTAPQDVSGKVFENNGTTPIADATVTLKPINKTTKTNDTGDYTFTDIPEGSYNLVITRGTGDNAVTITEKVVVEGAPITGKNVSFLEGNKNTVVEVAPGTPEILVGGMNDLLNVTNIGTTLSSNEEKAVTAGGSVEIKVIADEKTNSSEVAGDKGKIEALLTDGKIATILDLAVLKTVKNAVGTVITNGEKMPTLAQLIEVTVVIPQDMRSKPGLALYRVHNGVAEELTTTANSDGEMCTFSADKTYATLMLKKFSTFAFAHTAYKVNVEFGGGSGSYAPGENVPLNAGSKSGHVFSHWSTTTAGVVFANANSSSTTFTMPNGPVSITANWTLVGDDSSNSSGGSAESYLYITAKAGKGGSFSTPERVQVRAGESAGFTITPNKGYKIADVKVNGKSVGAVNSYVFTNILSNQSITASFASIADSDKSDISKEDTKDKTEGETEESTEKPQQKPDDLQKVKGDLAAELEKKRGEALDKLPDTLTDEQSQKAIDEIYKIYDEAIKALDNAKSADAASEIFNQAVRDFGAASEKVGAAIDTDTTGGKTNNLPLIIISLLLLLLLIIIIIIILKRKKKEEQ